MGDGGWREEVCVLVSLFFAAAAFGQAPTPESVLGYKPGADFHLAATRTRWATSANWRRPAIASNWSRSARPPKGVSGGSLSSPIPKNLAQLDHYKDVSRRLALARGVTEEQARALARETKPFIHIDGGLHATEVANHQHTIQLGYDLATSEEPEFQAIRQNLIVELWFSINPDGRPVADWYRQNVGTAYEVSPFPVLSRTTWVTTTTATDK